MGDRRRADVALVVARLGGGACELWFCPHVPISSQPTCRPAGLSVGSSPCQRCNVRCGHATFVWSCGPERLARSLLKKAPDAWLGHIVTPGSPGCLPGHRFPRSRSDRSVLLFSFLCGPSEEGGREDVDESWRARRSSSSTRAESRSFSAVSRSTCPVSSAISRYAAASRTVSPAAGSADSSSAEGRP